MPRKSSSANAPKRSDSNVRRIIGANIKARRLALDWNQQELADLFGVSRSAISQFEIGTGEVNAGDLPRLGQILGLELLDFYRPPVRADLPARVESGGVERVGDLVQPADSNEGEWIPIGAPIIFVPTKGGDGNASEVKLGSPSEEYQEAVELGDVLQGMTSLERKTLLRIALVLKGTLGT